MVVDDRRRSYVGDRRRLFCLLQWILFYKSQARRAEKKKLTAGCLFCVVEGGKLGTGGR